MMAARHREREPPQPGRSQTEKSDSQHDIDTYKGGGGGVKLGVGEIFHVFRSPSKFKVTN